MTRRGTPISRLNPATMRGPGDDRPPEPDPDDPECPECGGPMNERNVSTWRGRQVGSWVCCDEDCEGTYNNEPDWESIAESRRRRY